MVNFENYKKCFLLLLFVCYSSARSTQTLDHRLGNDTFIFNKNKSQLSPRKEYNKNNHSDNATDGRRFNYSRDLLAAAADYQHPQLRLPSAIKPRGFNLPKNRPTALDNPNHTPQSAAQSLYGNYFSDLSNFPQAQPYYALSEDPLISKLLSQHARNFQPRHQEFSPHDAGGILGSGDFGILRGGTFYSSEEQAATSEEEASDFYYGDASDTHAVASTEGFIQKYTHPEEQFAQFRDFADLGTPVDSAFSHYLVVYAAKNATATATAHQNSKPKNIFEQLLEIDKEKALEQKKIKKIATNPSITKLKLVKTKQMEKKWSQKQPLKVPDDDPLIALS